jgi:CubicO group peptidase (beta-lactamase class C family)
VIGGTCDSRFEPVRAAFCENFTQRGETGAAICVTIGGRVVADLWGGWTSAAKVTRWQPDTLVNLFSVGKGWLALLAAQLTGTGLLDTDAPVARYWREFAAAGKQAVTLRQLLSHQAGVPALRRRMPPNAMLDWRAMTGAIAEERPWWQPGTAHGYHVNTFGFAVGEVLRRVSGRSVGALLREQVAGPLGADIHIGLAASEHGRVAEFSWPGEVRQEQEPAGRSDDELMRYNAYFNPAGLSGSGVVNTASWRSAEVPSANGHGSARGIARVYAALAAGDIADGAPVVDPGALADAISEQVYGPDLVLHRPSRFGLGFQLTAPERPMGHGQSGFGHFGAGGSLGCCDPEAGVAIGYVTGQMGPRWQNPRNRAVLDAIYASL